MRQAVTSPRSSDRAPVLQVLTGLGGAAAVAILSAAIGVGLVALAAGTHPAVVVLAPVAVMATVAMFDRPWIGVAGVVAAVPLALVELSLGPFDLIEVVVLGAAVTLVLHRVVAGRSPLPWPPVAWWPLAIGLLALVSATRAADLTVAIGQLLLLGVGGLAFLVTVGALRGDDDVRRVAVAWCLAGIGVSLHALAGAGDLAATSGGLTVDGRPTGVFSSPNQLGAYAGMTLLVALGLVLAARDRWQRLVAAGAVLAATGAVGVSLSRGAWVGVGVAGLAFVASLPGARRHAGRLLVSGVALAVLVGTVLLPRAPAQLDIVSQRVGTLVEGETSPYDNRDAIWDEGVRQVFDAPWLGQGPANFPVVSRRATSTSSFVSAEHAHNLPLNIAAEFGIPALFLVIGFTVALFRLFRAASRRLRRLGDRALVAGAAGVLVVQVAHGAVDYTLRNATIAVLTWVTAGIVVTLAHADAPTTTGAPTRPG